MATKQLLALVASLSLLTSGCGGGDEAEAKQAALAPATPAAADVEETPAPTTPAADSAAPVAKPVAPPADSAAVAASAPVDSAAVDPNAPADQSGVTDRENFSYSGGSRDPFVSLLATTNVGPELPDLLLVAIYYDTRIPGNSVVVMRDKVGARKYNLRPGDRLGRMRVASVRPKDVTFTIDDFGTERQETVSLRKQEETQ
ncbi:MAG: hypothetical protein JNJ80_03340 [Gemmatimonadetes bacterium]|nr:hypothetical protein [Gemmatimonadota bacterium]